MIKKLLKDIFKKFSYGVFFQIYGKINKSISCNEDDRIKITTTKPEKNLSYRVYKISSGRLYTDRVHDTAVLLDNKIIEEPSFQLRQTFDSKIYNSKIENNIVFKIGTPRKLRKLNGSILSLLTGGGGNNNYWHWLFDVLPRLGLLNSFTSLDEIDYFLLPDLVKKYQNETLDSLNIPEHKRLSSRKFRHIKTQELIITDHPVVTTGNATKDIMNMPKWISQWLKINFIKESVIQSSKSTKKIYIDRKDNTLNQPPQRSIENEDEIKQYLLKKDFNVIKLHEINFIDQVKLFYNAECVVGLHGGGFANLSFCKPNTKVVELRSTDAGTPIQNLAKKNDLDYSSIIVDAKKSEKFKFPDQHGSIQVPIDDLVKLIEN